MKKHQMLIGLAIVINSIYLTACNPGGSGSRAADTGGTTSVPGGSVPVPPDDTEISDPKGTATADKLSMAPLAQQVLFTKDASENTCVPIKITATQASLPLANVGIKLSIQGNSSNFNDKGSLIPDAGVTDEAGEFTAAYCSGQEEGTLTLYATTDKISVNSEKITISKKPVYSFRYQRSDVDPLLTPADAGEQTDAIFLNLVDSGPQDCTTLYFKLTKSGAPVVGVTQNFRTQIDFPKGAKLGKRADALKTEVDLISGKKYSVYTATSTSSGEFPVPICSGVSLGTILVSGSFVDEEDRVYTAHSPIIRITAGLTNFINMSLTFDLVNGRTLKGYYNTNSSYELPITVQLGARQDGNPITDYPVAIASEVGNVSITNGGIPDKEAGSVGAKLKSLHLIDNYPYFTTSYTGYPLAQTRCEPQSLAQWATANSLTAVNYSDLRKNWRSTFIYSVRGQEHFHDANRNGLYDLGGDGFWDKNQNGYFDTGDVLTFDAGANGTFNPNGEWFIDLPTPFVDVDENGIYEASKDILVGDEYIAPNGKRDADTLIWKYEYFPVSMGPSAYGVRRARIIAADYNSLDNPATMPWGGNYEVSGVLPINAADLWPGADADRFAASAVYPSVLFAHDLCGNLLPGGTDFNIQFSATYTPTYGARLPAGRIYMQPGDHYLEASRHLLKNAAGGASALINFNAVDHASANSGYPLLSYIEVPACTNTCTGAVQGSPGIACDAYSGMAIWSLKEPALDTRGGDAVSVLTDISFGQYNACNCVANATQAAGVCSCNPGREFQGGVCVLIP